MGEKIAMVHGSGGRATGELIENIFASAFSDEMEDAAVVSVPAADIAMTTDSFVVTPLTYRGGNLGRLAVCGTVNDLLMRGAKPLYITCGWILEEGAEIDLLRQLVTSMQETAEEAGVRIVAGDTKVINGNGGIYVNTAGVGTLVPAAWETGPGKVLPGVFARSPENNSIENRPSAANGRPIDIRANAARPGDVIIVSGPMGDHHAAIMSERLSIDTDIASDNAPLVDIVGNLIRSGIEIRTLRDITRGGLATVLKELSEASRQVFVIEQAAIPVSPAVSDFAALLGLDPLYMGNEGKLAAVVAEKDAEKALAVMRSSRYGEGAAVIGHVEEAGAAGRPAGSLVMKTPIGGERFLTVLEGEGLPRIC